MFCATQQHALLVRDLINQIKISPAPDYCVRVTANDGQQGGGQVHGHHRRQLRSRWQGPGHQQPG